MTTPSTAEGPGPREGLITGLLGAAIVAAFFLILDVISGIPLQTPSILGQVLLMRDTAPVIDLAVMPAVAAYTVVHMIAFTVFGLFLTGMVRLSETSSVARYAVLQLLVVFLFAFYALLAVASEVTRGFFPLWGVLAANVCAATAMSVYLWKRHPRFRYALKRTPLGAGEAR